MKQSAWESVYSRPCRSPAKSSIALSPIKANSLAFPNAYSHNRAASKALSPFKPSPGQSARNGASIILSTPTCEMRRPLDPTSSRLAPSFSWSVELAPGILSSTIDTFGNHIQGASVFDNSSFPFPQMLLFLIN